MPWTYALLRGQKVLARVKPDGALDAQGGRVEIRYKPTDAKAYRAAGNNLSVIPGSEILADDACVGGAFVGDKSDKKKAPAEAPAAIAGAWSAYTDGACSGNPGPAGAGFIVTSPEGKIVEGSVDLGVSTNNVAELTAILLAVEAIPEGAGLIVVHTDSKYAIGVLSKGWKAKVNQELIANTRRTLASRKNVRFVYVPGHAGVPMNERADELARAAVHRGRE